MRLFYQLDDEEREAAINQCINNVIQDIVDGNVDLDPQDEEEIALQMLVNNAHEHCKTIEDYGDKAEHIMSNGELSAYIFEMANEMSKSAMYCEDEEMVIYTSTLKHEHCENCEHGEENAEEFPEIEEEKKKSDHSLN